MLGNRAISYFFFCGARGASRMRALEVLDDPTLGAGEWSYARDDWQRSSDFSHRSRRVFCPYLRALLDLGGGHCTDLTGAGDRRAPAALFLCVELQRVGAGNSGSMGAPL